MLQPTIGQIVNYTLSQHDVDAINARPIVQHSPIGAPRQTHAVKAGDTFQMTITHLHEKQAKGYVAGQVDLGDNDIYMVETAKPLQPGGGDSQGTFAFSTAAVDQARKDDTTDDAENIKSREQHRETVNQNNLATRSEQDRVKRDEELSQGRPGQGQGASGSGARAGSVTGAGQGPGSASR